MPDKPELTAAIAAWNALDAAISDVDRLARTLRQKLGAVVNHQATANDREFPHSFTTLDGPDITAISDDAFQREIESAFWDNATGKMVDLAGVGGWSGAFGRVARYVRTLIPPAPQPVARVPVAMTELLAAAHDALSGWRYIRAHHGDFYGVGWDRVEEGLERAIARAEGRT